MTHAAIAQRIVAYQGLPVPELVAEYAGLFGEPPHCKNRRWLWKNCAWKLQERELGGLPDDAKARLEELIAEVVIPPAGEAARLRRAKGRRELAPGTTLTRVWHGVEVAVRVTESGFEWDGKPYRSLSAVARAITGQAWSGNLFFGLRGRSKKGAAA